MEGSLSSTEGAEAAAAAVWVPSMAGSWGGEGAREGGREGKEGGRWVSAG